MTIAKVINDVKKIISGTAYDYEILTVDDNSTDATARIAESCGARVIQRVVNGYAVKYIPTQYYKRIEDSKFHLVKDTYNYLQTVFIIIVCFNPLKIFLPLSLLVFIFGVIKTICDRYFFIHRMQVSDIVILLVSVII